MNNFKTEVLEKTTLVEILRELMSGSRNCSVVPSSWQQSHGMLCVLFSFCVLFLCVCVSLSCLLCALGALVLSDSPCYQRTFPSLACAGLPSLE